MNALQRFKDAGGLAAELPFATFLDETTLLLKSGAVMSVIALEGCDVECRDPQEIESVAFRFEAATRVFDERDLLYQCQIKRRLTERTELFSIATYIAVVSDSQRKRIATKDIGPSLVSATGALARKTAAFCAALNGGIGSAVCNAEQTFRFLVSMLNYDERRARAVLMRNRAAIDAQVCNSRIIVDPHFIRVGDRVSKVLTLKTSAPEQALPEETTPNYLRALLKLPYESIIVTQFRPFTPGETRLALEQVSDHLNRNKVKASVVGTIVGMISGLLHNSQQEDGSRTDAVAVQSASEVDTAIIDAGMRGLAFGSFMLTVIVSGEDEREAAAAADSFITTGNALHIALYEEAETAQLPWLAAIPGNDRFQVRAPMKISSSVYGDLSLFYAPDEGEPVCQHLKLPCLAEMQTADRTLYNMNIHDNDLAMSILIGKAGSGKTFTCLHLIRQVIKRWKGGILTFDMKDSYRELIEKHGGKYMKVGAKGAVRINPMSLAASDENYQFLTDFIGVLIESGGYRLTDADRKDIWQQVIAVYEAIPEGRRRLREIVLPKHLQGKLDKWLAVGSDNTPGQYGWMFDNTEDTLSFESIQGYGFGDLDTDPTLLEPLLFYVLHRASRQLAEGGGKQFKLFLLDEAWLFLKNKTVRDYVISALRTWREKNAAVLMATQSTAELESSEMAGIIVECAATLLLTANPLGDTAWYKNRLRLNDAQANHVLTMAMKKELMVVQTSTGRAKIGSLVLT